MPNIEKAYTYLTKVVAHYKESGVRPNIPLLCHRTAWIFDVDSSELKDLYYGFKKL